MTVRVRVAVALAAFVLLAPVRGLAADAKLRGIAIDQRLDAEPLPADLPGIVPTIVRLSIEATAVHRSGCGRDPRTPAATCSVRTRAASMTVVLALGRVPAADSDVEPWRQFIRAVAERSRGASPAIKSAKSRRAPTPDVNRYVYLLKLAAVQIRSVDAGALVLQGASPPAKRTGRAACSPPAPGRTSMASRSTALPADEDEPFRSAVERMVALVEREKPSATMLLGPIRLPAGSGCRHIRADGCRAALARHERSASPPSPATPPLFERRSRRPRAWPISSQAIS